MLVPGAETRPKRSSEGFDLGVLFGVFKGCPISQWLGSCPKPMADLRGARVLLSGETRWEQASLGFFGCCIFFSDAGANSALGLGHARRDLCQPQNSLKGRYRVWAACPRDSPAQVVAPAECQAPFSVRQMGPPILTTRWYCCIMLHQHRNHPEEASLLWVPGLSCGWSFF